MDEDLTEEQIEALQEQIAGDADIAPNAPLKDSIFKFFREILKMEDTTRVGNLKDDEIGRTRKPERQLQDVANFADAMEMKEVSKYFMRKSWITSTTSMGRKGFLAQLFVTQIKKEQKITPAQPNKGRFFTPKQPETTGEEQ